MSDPSAQEVLLLALINRARLDPAAEAARLGIDLNEGLAPGTLSADSSQPLAFSAALQTAAEAHSQAMIDSDYFAHTDPNTGSTPQSRANGAGYSGGVGENISWRGTTGTPDPTAFAVQQYGDLFVDANVSGRGHRLNILDDRYQEVGIGQVMGAFTVSGNTYNASMITQDFGIPAAPGQILTGIAYNDSDGNDFYSVGEGRGGIAVVTAGGATATGTAGAYAQHVGVGDQAVTFSGGGLPGPVKVLATVTAGENAMVNLIDGTTVETSVSLREVSGVATIIGRGTHDLTLAGAGGDDTIIGSLGNDRLIGGAGNDTMRGGAGDDSYYVANSGDIVDETGGSGTDKVYSSLSFNLGNPNRVHGAVENLVLTGTGDINGTGNALANSITGNAGANTLQGGLGNDRLDGRDGNDLLVGGSGADRLTGGAGADHFVFNSIIESTLSSANRDVILDFSRAQGDKIDLSGIDAQTGVSGNQAFHFIGTAAFGHHAGELRYAVQNGNAYVYADVNGDGTTDFSVQVSHMTALQSSDFIL
ncbi:CAP domain-containing protein [Labrys wisconsinensis]|uniref:Ca2+-binding RTX toxin-like protein n=1 Tax=Labrys wisconsinensis TaxID=425677 RepID=A0ABU0J995_9HYPH|nr:CAP domain-containing protein [Labrys wisconsinensis]MDQ0470844.1 Ca2+-binding RTX toxin-like protein [Labrys wisconsinensis]